MLKREPEPGGDGAQDRRAALAAGAAPRADLLGVLLDARDEDGQPMTDEELWEVRLLKKKVGGENDELRGCQVWHCRLCLRGLPRNNCGACCLDAPLVGKKRHVAIWF